MIVDSYGLSPLQQGLVFQSIADPQSGIYVEQIIGRCQERLDIEALQQSWQQVAARHTIFRTTIHLDPQPHQCVYQSVSLPLTLYDWREWSESEQTQQFQAFLQRDRHQGFPLEQCPGMRLTVFQLAPTAYSLVWTFHHALIDGASAVLVLKEVFTLYDGLGDRRPAMIRETRPYGDYLRWLETQSYAEAKPFWQHLLHDFTTPNQLPRIGLDLPEKTGFAQQDRWLLSGLTATLVTLSRHHRFTLGNLCQGIWALLLSRYCGDLDVVFGVTRACRNSAFEGSQSVVGPMINTLPMRIKMDPQQSLWDWLRQIRSQWKRLQPYQLTPLSEIHRWLGWPRHQSLFQSTVVFEQLTMDGAIHVGNQMGVHRSFELRDQPDFPLNFCGFGGEQLLLRINYDPRHYEEAVIARMLEYLEQLLVAITQTPDGCLGDLPDLAASDSQQLALWNQTQTVVPVPFLPERLTQQAKETPDAIALTCGDQQICYQALEQRTNQLAGYLQQLGVRPEVLVGVCLERSIEGIVALLGILKAGGAYVPLDPNYPASRLAWMLNDSKVAVLLTQHSLREQIPEVVATVVCLDQVQDEIAQVAPIEKHPTLEPDHLAYVIYTSGSTGHPKGVMIEHRALANFVAAAQVSYGIQRSDGILQFASLSFDVAAEEIYPALTCGARVVLMPPSLWGNVPAFVEQCQQQQVTVLDFPTAYWHQLTQALLASQLKLPNSVRLIIIGGEQATWKQWQTWQQYAAIDSDPVPRLINAYGPTEATVETTLYRFPEPQTETLSSQTIPIGQPLANTQVYLLDQQLKPVPIGVPGELHIAGTGLARGYLHRPELTAERFIQVAFKLYDPMGQSIEGANKDGSGYIPPATRLFKTGDLAKYLPDGNLVFLDRLDRQVKIRGFRIELGEIEAVLSQHSQVRSVAVTLSQSTAIASELIAYVVVTSTLPTQQLRAQLSAFLKDQLPDHMVPTQFIALETLPLTPNGKIDYPSLPDPTTVKPNQTLEWIEEKNTIEQAIAAVWQQVLQQGQIDHQDNFFDLGGNSLSMMQVLSQLQTTIAQDLSLVDLFRYPTIAQLSQYLQHHQPFNLDSSASQPTHTCGATSEVQQTRIVDPWTPSDQTEEIAIIGLAGRFPGAATVDQFWQNLCTGKESITFFSDTELQNHGVDPALLQQPNYVKAQGILAGVDEFDATFFGCPPREAQITDPQHRLLLECAWQALEQAGYDAEQYEGKIGVYAGASFNTYWLNQIVPNRKLFESLSRYQLAISNDKDFIPTRISYKLNLKGPSVNVNTACSTSLVAVHEACQSLRSHQCDLALAGGVSVKFPQQEGYLHQDGMILSPDGHCRPFDAQAQGTVQGSGLGLVVLKRLSAACAEGDRIYAVIKGSAINNDGSQKAGYTAPSVAGQAQVIVAAQTKARVTPETISYIETHGTGTPLGDPIEIAALTQAFRQGTTKTGFCKIGSVKSNIGHLDAAAGIAGLLKTVLALHHQKIPATLHFNAPNPAIDLATSPFSVNGKLTQWQRSEHYPRRAGVSAFGIGGTNAHVILEEAPTLTSFSTVPEHPSAPLLSTEPSTHLLILSAKSPAALDRMTTNLANFLQQNPTLNLADIAYTLGHGRRAFAYRCMLTCTTHQAAITALTADGSPLWQHHVCETSARKVVFMFSGQGSQYVNMARGLYHSEPIFRQWVDHCCDRLKPLLNRDLRTILYPQATETKMAQETLQQTAITQPALFTIEYALAQLWMAWGVQPQTLIGHSIGEYVAATLAGVFTLDDALALVVARGQLMQSLPKGSMLAVSLSEEEIQPYLTKDVVLGAINGRSLCVVSGLTDPVAALQQQLTAQSIPCQPVRTSHGFHSPMMQSIVPAFAQRLRKVTLQSPKIPCLSNVTGTWLTAAEATDPDYWTRQLCQTVRFADGLAHVFHADHPVLLEVGPGRTLCSLAKRHPDKPHEQWAIASTRHPQDSQSDVDCLRSALGQLWLVGVPIQWQQVYRDQPRQRVELPTYPFAKQSHWIEAPKIASPRIDSPHSTAPIPRQPRQGVPKLQKVSDIADWFYYPSWERSVLSNTTMLLPQSGTCLLVLMDQVGLGAALVDRLQSQGHQAIAIHLGATFQSLNATTFTLNPQQRDDYDQLFQALHSAKLTPTHVLHLWSLSDHDQLDAAQGEIPDEPSNEALTRGFYSLLLLTQALANSPLKPGLKILVIANQLQAVTGQERLCPEKATLLGALKVITQEYPHITCQSLDLDFPGSALSATHGSTAPWWEKSIEQLLQELEFIGKTASGAIAYRNHHRWCQTFKPIRFEPVNASNTSAHSSAISSVPIPTSLPRRLRPEGVYLITGGLGQIGLALAEYFAKSCQANLVLTTRQAFPDTSEWPEIIQTSHASHAHEASSASLVEKVRRLQALEALGARVCVVQADVADREQMAGAIALAQKRWGALHGVIHAAGVVAGPSFREIETIAVAACQLQFRAKIQGTVVLGELLSEQSLDFCLLMSSLASILGGLEFVAYAAANQFLDTFAQQQNHSGTTSWLSVNWEGWQFESTDAPTPCLHPSSDSNGHGNAPGKLGQTLQQLALRPAEGIDVLQRVLNQRSLDQIVVSTTHLHARMEQWLTPPAMQVLTPNATVVPDCTSQQPSLSSNGPPKPHLSTNAQANHRKTHVAQTSLMPSPTQTIEQTITQIWQQQLGITAIGRDDDFFALGGDSLIAVHLATQLRQALNVKLSPKTFIEAPTIAQLTSVITQQVTSTVPSQQSTTHASVLVKLQGGNPERSPLFLIHPAGGSVYWYHDLVRHLDPEQPIFGLQDPTLEGENIALDSVEAIASYYLKAIQTQQPKGPYSLGGASFGGTIAFEMAQQLKVSGQEIALLTLMDSPSRGTATQDESFLGILQLLLEASLNITIDVTPLQPLTQAEQLNYFAQQMQASNQTSFPYADMERVREVVTRFQHHSQVLQRYHPKPYDGPMLYFRAQDQQAKLVIDPETAWRPLVIADLIVYEIPGNHFTMNFSPHVQVIAQHINSVLMLIDLYV